MGYVKNHIYSVGEIINGLMIVEQTRIKLKAKTKTGEHKTCKGYTVKCPDDGYVFVKDESSLMRGCGCPVCSGQLCVSGINDVATTRPDLIDYFLIKDEARNYTSGSGMYIKTQCPICEHLNAKETAIYNLAAGKFNCENESCKNNRHNKIASSIIQDFKLDIGSVINGLEVKGRMRIDNKKHYEVYCDKCDVTHVMFEYNLLNRNFCCPSCSGRKVVKGVNDIATTHQHLVKYFSNTEDAYTHSYGSNKKVLARCDKCLSKKYVTISNLNTNGYSCDNTLCENNGHKKSATTRKNNFIIDDSVFTKRRDLVNLFLNKDDSKRFGVGSKKKVDIVCPECNSVSKIRVGNLCNQGFSCKSCGDGVSIPEKFIFGLLKNQNVNFITQLSKSTFEWCGKFRYDFYIPHLNTIVETHGKQHYEDSSGVFFKSLYEQNEIDNIKEELAIKNGISNYIQLDCKLSTLEWLKESVVNSGLPNLLNFDEEDIDWTTIYKYTSSSMVIEACELWKKGYSIKTISNMTNMSRDTIRNWLKMGTDMGIIKYTITQSRKRGATNDIKYNARLCVCNGKIFKSVVECAKSCNVSSSVVRRYLNGERKMPQKYIDLGLRYATEDDLRLYGEAV